MSDYHLLISGPDLAAVACLEIDCEDERTAMEIAASIASPYGHDLLQGGRFIGRFNPGWGELLERYEDLAEP